MSHIFDASALEDVLRPAPPDALIMLLAERLLRAQRLYVVATSVGELQDSILQMHPLEARNAERNLGLFFGLIGPTRILNFDVDDAREWGRLRFKLESSPELPFIEELLVAAVATRHQYTIVTTLSRSWHSMINVRYEYL
ncbi:putative nucleic acid-binding protein [Bradyrhizobium sp. F1.13.1]